MGCGREDGSECENGWKLDMAANKCPLANQFRLVFSRLIYTSPGPPFLNHIPAEFVICRENKAIVSHCPDLFRGCQISLNVKVPVEKWAFIEECLTFLEPANPVEINISLGILSRLELLRHPTIWNCARLSLFWPSSSAPINLMREENAMALFDWLHHRPTMLMHGDDDLIQQEQQVRHLILSTGNRKFTGIDWLLNRCVQHFRQSRGPGQCHQFMLCFSCQNGQDLLDQFGRIENHSTGEMLELHTPIINGLRDDNLAFYFRRCLLANEVVDGGTFYTKMMFFKPIERSIKVRIVSRTKKPN